MSSKRSVKITIVDNPSGPQQELPSLHSKNLAAESEHALSEFIDAAPILVTDNHPQTATSGRVDGCRESCVDASTLASRRASVSVVARDSVMHKNPMANAQLAVALETLRASSLKEMGSERLMSMTAPERAALFEHKIIATSCSRTSVLRREFGRGIYGYFVFLQYLIVVNVVLAAIASAIFGMSYDDLVVHGKFAAFFTAVYPASSRTAWLATTCIIVSAIPVAGLLYPLIHKRVTQESQSDMMDTAGSDHREDVSTRSATHAERRYRRMISAGIFVLSISAQAVITYLLFSSLPSRSESYIAVLVALSNNVLNFCQKFLSKQLTRMELHRKVTTHREADTIKLFTLKFVNVILLYIIKAFTPNADTELSLEPTVQELTCNNNVVPCDCPLLSQGWTFMWLLVFDVAFSVFVEPLAGMSTQCYRRACANRKGLSDYDVKLDFDVAQELVSVLYRQFIILLGAPVFPLITVFGVIAYVIEYYMDRVKLVNLCKKQIIKEEPMDLRLIVICTVLVGVAAAFSFPQGVVFVGHGYRAGSCRFFS